MWFESVTTCILARVRSPGGMAWKITDRSDQSAQSYQPGDLIAFLKNAVLWPIQSCAFFSLRNRSIISRELGFPG